ncbi:MAG: DUF1552 domain-containing protein [Myxococcaceae bacterium]|nr:DUF1552 domain-containing protein [Myxococcaceae bacterium]
MKPFRLSRRTMLRGLGTALALPALEAMLPARASAQAAAAPLRFLTVFIPNGVRMDLWKPTTTGTSFTLPATLQPLQPYKSKLSVVSGLSNYPASITTQEFAGAHARGTGALLTQCPLAFTSGTNIKNGISVDQVIANSLKTQTRLPSLELGARAGSQSGNCEDGYSCAYVHNLSWSGPTTPMPKMTKPRDVFNRLFAGGVPSADAGTPMVDPSLVYDRSVLDAVAGRARALQLKLGTADRQKLDEYLTAVRAVEQRVQALSTPPPVTVAQCTPGTAPTDPTDYQLLLDTMSDMIALAFRCDITRVSTFMLQDSLDTPTINYGGAITASHHELSHHGNDATKLAGLAKIDLFEAQRFAYLLSKLDVPEANGSTVLDNSIVLFTSDFGDGDDHYHWNLPMVVAGKGGGKLKTGQHVSYAHTSGDTPASKTDMPLANLFLNVLQAFNLNQSTFGTDGTNPYGTKPLPELIA